MTKKKLSLEVPASTLVPEEIIKKKPITNLTIAQKIQIQEEKAIAANLATQIEAARKLLAEATNVLSICLKNNLYMEKCISEKKGQDEAKVNLNLLTAKTTQHEILAKQVTMNFVGGTKDEKRLLADDVNIQNKKINLEDLNKKFINGNADEKDILSAKAELKESEKEKDVDFLNQKIKLTNNTFLLNRLHHEMDAAKDSLEEAKDLAASLTGKALMMKQANA